MGPKSNPNHRNPSLKLKTFPHHATLTTELISLSSRMISDKMNKTRKKYSRDLTSPDQYEYDSQTVKIISHHVAHAGL